MLLWTFAFCFQVLLQTFCEAHWSLEQGLLLFVQTVFFTKFRLFAAKSSRFLPLQSHHLSYSSNNLQHISFLFLQTIFVFYLPSLLRFLAKALQKHAKVKVKLHKHMVFLLVPFSLLFSTRKVWCSTSNSQWSTHLCLDWLPTYSKLTLSFSVNNQHIFDTFLDSEPQEWDLLWTSSSILTILTILSHPTFLEVSVLGS